MAGNCNLSMKVLRNLFLIWTLSGTLGLYAKESWKSQKCSLCNSSICQCVSEKTYKVIVVFQQQFYENFHSKAFVVIATNGRHCSWGTIHYKHSLLLQSKVGRDVGNQDIAAYEDNTKHFRKMKVVGFS